jgi:hypothetical protein
MNPVARRTRVPLPGASSVPRRVERHLLRHHVDTRHPERERADRDRAYARELTVKPTNVVSDRQHDVAGIERRMRCDTELANERVHCILLRSEPRTANVNAMAGALD